MNGGELRLFKFFFSFFSMLFLIYQVVTDAKYMLTAHNISLQPTTVEVYEQN